MTKQPVYHLDECHDCAHRHVCKYIDKIDKLLKRGDLPLDLQGASCNEYIPEDIIDEDWKDYVEDDGEEPSDLISFTVNHIASPMEFGGLKKTLEDKFFPNNTTPLENAGELVEGLNGAIIDVQNQGLKIDSISMHRDTMDALKPAFNTVLDLTMVVLVGGDKIPLKIDNGVEPGYFAIDVAY